MKARSWALVAVAGLATALLPVSAAIPSAPAAPTESTTIEVTGTAWLSPTFDPAITRYAVHPASDGTIHVDVPGAQAVW
ncbi:hypothetical protein, partial [Nocardioides sp. P5_C9_2]